MGDDAKIERANMDGTGNIVLVDKNIQMPSALTIDPSENIVYWADVIKHTVEKVNMDGTGRKLLMEIPNNVWGAISSLAVFNTQVFMTTPGNIKSKVPAGIFQCNRAADVWSNCSMVIKGMPFYASVKTYGRDSQPISKFIIQLYFDRHFVYLV